MKITKESMKKSVIFGAIALSAGLLFAACDPTTASSFSAQSQTLEQNQDKLIQAVPIPQLTTSQERLNISKRAQLFDNENKISYIYLISYGKVMTFYTVKGKVSSLNSYMSPQEQLVNSEGIPCVTADHVVNNSPGCGSSANVIQAPDVDGSYGTNTDGIFFFTAQGAYVEWKGDYMMADQPLQLSTPPELVQQVK